MRRIARRAASAFAQLALASVAVALSFALAVRIVPMPPAERTAQVGTLVHASDGSLLTGLLAPGQKMRFATRLGNIDASYIDMLVAYEDRNFRKHHGFDALAMLRAIGQAARHGRIVSGASTITMQLVRLLDPKPRTVGAKLLEILQALRLERRMSKDDILTAYLTLAPYGGNIEGVRAASLAYFGKEPSDLSPGQAALLVAIPQSPEARRPDRHPNAARAARDRVLATLARRGVIDAGEARLAALRAPDVRVPRLPGHGFHLARRLQRRDNDVATLIDAGFQRKAEAVARAALTRWDEAVNVAVMIVRNSDGAVVAHVGSGAPVSVSRDGFVDLTRAVRSPGSTLKPFIYGMAFERLLVHPDTIVADQPVDFAGYRPSNADGEYAGDLTIRQALVMSKNTVPVMLLDAIGVDAFLARFRSVRSPFRLGTPDREAGLAVALGGVGVTLEQMVRLYSVFANEGRLVRLRWTPDDRGGSVGNLLTPAAANAVADILADVAPPAGSGRLAARDGTRRLGFKTGTSYGFRDAWAIGFDKAYTVGVWIGRPDGAPHLGAYGVTAAAPVLMHVFDFLPAPAHGAGSGRHPLGALASPRDLPHRLQRFGPPIAQAQGEKLAILFPKPGSEIAGGAREGVSVPLPFRLAGGLPPYRWTVAGNTAPPQEGTEFWADIETRGKVSVTVTDAEGHQASTSFWFE